MKFPWLMKNSENGSNLFEEDINIIVKRCWELGVGNLIRRLFEHECKDGLRKQSETKSICLAGWIPNQPKMKKVD